MTKERSGFPLVLKGVKEDEGIVEAVVSVFNNVDSAGDRILPGAFTKSLEKKLPKIVWMHDWGSPVGKTLQAQELNPGDDSLPEEIREYGGLKLDMEFNLDTQRGREAFSDIKKGIIDEFSIGFGFDDKDTESKAGVREFKEVTLYEASPVLYGANPDTQMISAKSGLNDHIEATGEAVEAMVNRVRDRANIREKEGRKLSGKNIETLKGVADAMQSGSAAINELLERNAPKPKEDDSEKALIARERQRELLRIQGIIT